MIVSSSSGVWENLSLPNTALTSSLVRGITLAMRKATSAFTLSCCFHARSWTSCRCLRSDWHIYCAEVHMTSPSPFKSCKLHSGSSFNSGRVILLQNSFIFMPIFLNIPKTAVHAGAAGEMTVLAVTVTDLNQPGTATLTDY